MNDMAGYTISAEMITETDTTISLSMGDKKCISANKIGTILGANIVSRYTASNDTSAGVL